jgi:putative addiction module component (TIGR02574 family)
MARCAMPPKALDVLLKLSPEDRAELAMVLWESLDDTQREKEFSLTSKQLADLDRRVAEHVADPASAIPWSKVRRNLTRKK